jgi:DNA-binding protein H-NS
MRGISRRRTSSEASSKLETVNSKEQWMATSYSRIQRKIDALKAKADSLRLKEVDGVVARIKEAIAHYGLTMKDLFGGKTAGKGRGAKRAANGRA